MVAKIKRIPARTDFQDEGLTNVGSVSLDEITSDSSTSIGVTLGDDAGDDFKVDNTSLVVEGDTGKVGIGTATPATTLDVVGGITATSGNDGTGTVAVRSGNAAQYSKISLGTNANKATVGVSGATDTFFTGVAQDDLVIRADDNNSKVHIGAGTSGPAAMVVTEVANVGKVGVGTTDPAAQLEVQDSTTSSANTGGTLRLSADDGAAMGDSHRLGVIEFGGAEDAGGSITVGARIESMTDAAWSGSENGAALYFYTTDADASQSNVLKLDSNKKSTFNGVVDITDTTDSSDATGDTGALRCEGGASIAKKLYVGTDADIDGTLEADAITIGGAGIGTIYSPIAGSSSIVTTGSIGTGTWQGSVIASAYLDGDTAHLTGTQTFSGAKTFSSASTHAGMSLSDQTSLNISTPSVGADLKATGITATMVAGAAIAAFEVVCCSTTTGKIVKTDSNAIGTMPVIGIATEAFSGDDEQGAVLLEGFARNDAWGWTPGAILYASETPGEITATAPTAGFVQAIGVALTADIIKFSPSLTLVEVAS